MSTLRIYRYSIYQSVTMKSLCFFLMLLSVSTSFSQETTSAHITKMLWNDCIYKCTADTNKNALLPNYELKDSIYFMNGTGKLLPNLQFPELDKEKAKGYYNSGKWNANHKSFPRTLSVPSQYFGSVSYSENLGDLFHIQGIVRKGSTQEKMEIFMSNGKFGACKFTLTNDEGKDTWGLFGFDGNKFYLIKSSGITSVESKIISNPLEWMNKFRTVWMECYAAGLTCD